MSKFDVAWYRWGCGHDLTWHDQTNPDPKEKEPCDLCTSICSDTGQFECPRCGAKCEHAGPAEPRTDYSCCTNLRANGCNGSGEWEGIKCIGCDKCRLDQPQEPRTVEEWDQWLDLDCDQHSDQDPIERRECHLCILHALTEVQKETGKRSYKDGWADHGHTLACDGCGDIAEPRPGQPQEPRSVDEWMAYILEQAKHTRHGHPAIADIRHALTKVAKAATHAQMKKEMKRILHRERGIYTSEELNAAEERGRKAGALAEYEANECENEGHAGHNHSFCEMCVAEITKEAEERGRKEHYSVVQMLHEQVADLLPRIKGEVNIRKATRRVCADEVVAMATVDCDLSPTGRVQIPMWIAAGIAAMLRKGGKS